MDLTVCMIVRNEEKNLADAIKSILPLRCKVIVGDTGSTDQSKNIALSMGAQVIDVTWKNDYSFARNQLLKHVTSKWVLILDADEIVPEKTLIQIPQLIASPQLQGVVVLNALRVSPNEQRQEKNVFSRFLFNFNSGLIFNGVVHETVQHSSEKVKRYDCPQLKVVHKIPNNLKQIKKHNYYIHLLLSQLEKDSLDKWLRLKYLKHYGDSLYALGYIEKAQIAYLQSLDIAFENPSDNRQFIKYISHIISKPPFSQAN